MQVVVEGSPNEVDYLEMVRLMLVLPLRVVLPLREPPLLGGKPPGQSAEPSI